MNHLTIDARGVIKPCNNCGKLNRLPFGRLNEAGRCAHCQTYISPPEQPVEVSEESHFDALIQQSTIPVVADFWADWCAPCRMMEPELQRAAAVGAGSFLLTCVDVGTYESFIQRFHIRSIPTLIRFDHGKETTRRSGVLQHHRIRRFALEPDRAPHPTP